MAFSLQIAAVAAVLIIGGLSILKIAAERFERRHPRREPAPPGE